MEAAPSAVLWRLRAAVSCYGLWRNSVRERLVNSKRMVMAALLGADRREQQARGKRGGGGPVKSGCCGQSVYGCS